MATINANFYVDTAHLGLLFNQFGGTGPIPALNYNDTLALQIFYLDDGSGIVPFRGHRYPGSTTGVQLRAEGNNTVYATQATTSEIVPAHTAPVVAVVAGGGSSVTEKESVTFAAGLFTGSFTITFSGAGSGLGGSVSLFGTTAPIPVSATAADILNAILNINGFYKSNDGPHTFADLVAFYGDNGKRPVVTGTPFTGFQIDFGTLFGGFNQWNTGIHPVTIDASDIQYAYGWNINLLLDGNGNTFADLFDVANGPAYLEIVLVPAGGSPTYVARVLLASSGGSSGAPPTSGGGLGVTVVGGIIYDGDHTSPYGWPIGVVRRESPFPEAPYAFIYRQMIRARRLYRAAPALDSPCPADGNAGLVEEGPGSDVGGADLTDFERVWATVPATIVDGEIVNYTWQTTGTIGGAPAIASIPLTRWAKRTRTFYRTTNPTGITLLRLPRAGVFAGVGLTFDGYTNLYGGTVTIARDDDLRRWMGNIWVKTHWDIKI